MPSATLEAREKIHSPTAGNDGQNQVPPDRAQQEERIRRRAHEIWRQRGGQAGSDVEDWLQAEAEISGKTEK